MDAKEYFEETYEILEELGQGGGGVVYHAVHKRLNTDVVIKKIKDEVVNRVKIRQEADMLKNLKHPNLPRVYDFIETDDGIYTVIDYIDGMDMEKALAKRGKFSQKEVVGFAKKLGSALEYLHSQKVPIIHSDIKPANIMLTNDGDVCLIDFNISLAAGDTLESAVGISAGFSPPEQYRDPATYARITHNYTLQNSLRNTSGNKNTDKNSVVANSEPVYANTEQACGETEMISGNTEVINDKTELVFDKTECTVDDKTECTVDDKTELIGNQSKGGQNIKAVQTSSAQDASGSVGTKYIKYIGQGISTRSDIYSLGMCLLTFLTGTRPSFDFDKNAKVEDYKLNVSDGLASIINKMIEIDPSLRFKDGKEFNTAIHNIYKMDQRYKKVYSTQNKLLLLSIISVCIGAAMITLGGIGIKRAKNTEYYSYIDNADTAINNHDFDIAQNEIAKAFAFDSSRISAYREELYLYYCEADYDKCISQGETYLTTTPYAYSQKDISEQADICYLVGNAYFENEDYKQAAYYLENALNIYTEKPEYYRDYAIVAAKLGDMNTAKEFLNTAKSIGIDQLSYDMAQAEIEFKEQSFDSALDKLSNIIINTSDDQIKRRSVMMSVEIFKAKGDSYIDKEIELLERTYNSADDASKNMFVGYLADSYSRKAQTLNPDSAKPYYDKAITLLNNVMSSNHVTYQFRENLGIIYENSNRFDEAEIIYQALIKDYPKKYNGYMRMAYLEADKQDNTEIMYRDYSKMYEYYNKAKEIAPNNDSSDMKNLELLVKDVIDGGWLNISGE